MSKTSIQQPSRDGEMVSSVLFGNGQSYPITQDFAEYNESTAPMYGYASAYGFPSGTHIGIDLGAPEGTPIQSLTDGVVEYAGYTGFFRPRPVAVNSPDGAEIIYGHLERDSVSQGQTVHKGDLLGYSGFQTAGDVGSERTSGDHIHVEVRKDGQAVDPMDYLTGGTGSGGGTLLSSKPGGSSSGNSESGMHKFFVGLVVVTLGVSLIAVGLAGTFPNQVKAAAKTAVIM